MFIVLPGYTRLRAFDTGSQLTYPTVANVARVYSYRLLLNLGCLSYELRVQWRHLAHGNMHAVGGCLRDETFHSDVHGRLVMPYVRADVTGLLSYVY